MAVRNDEVIALRGVRPGLWYPLTPAMVARLLELCLSEFNGEATVDSTLTELQTAARCASPRAAEGRDAAAGQVECESTDAAVSAVATPLTEYDALLASDMAFAAWHWEIARSLTTQPAVQRDASIRNPRELIRRLAADLGVLRIRPALRGEWLRLLREANSGVERLREWSATVDDLALARSALLWGQILSAPVLVVEQQDEFSTPFVTQVTTRHSRYFAGATGDSDDWRSDWRSDFASHALHLSAWQALLRGSEETSPDVDDAGLRRRRSIVPRVNAALADEDVMVANEVVCRIARPLLQRLARLVHLENSFAEQLETEKLAAMRQLAYGASHEINNPLANISSRAQILLRDERDPQRRRSLTTINNQAFRAHEMIADMMLFAKPPALELVDVDWYTFVRQQVTALEQETPEPIRVVQEFTGGTWRCRIDPTQIGVVLRAIWRNALEAMPGNGQITVRCHTLDTTQSGRVDHWACCEIEDTGPGLEPETRRHIFDPFYSGREAGRGLGFGLTKAWRIAQLHGGQLSVQSELGSGTRLTLQLPCSPPTT
ncbi:MAG: hypothetical protein KDB23_15710 [Planctomycetales bacterium]|nr:hypothetical protein [Planctomycetales bacterium]